MSKKYYIYIVTNSYSTTLYIGVTSNLIKRIFEHKSKLVDGFTKKYNLIKLIYFEEFNSVLEAIAREKQLKRWHREWKFSLIKELNPNLDDLYSEIIK